MIDESLLERYLNIDSKIKLVLKDKAGLIKQYHSTALLHSTWSWDENGDKITYPHEETIIIHYVDCESFYDELLTSLYFRKQRFDEYMSKLSKQQVRNLGTGNDLFLDLKTDSFMKQLEKQVKLIFRFNDK